MSEDGKPPSPYPVPEERCFIDGAALDELARQGFATGPDRLPYGDPARIEYAAPWNDPRRWALEVLDRARCVVEQLEDDDLVHLAGALRELERVVALPGLAASTEQ